MVYSKEPLIQLLQLFFLGLLFIGMASFKHNLTSTDPACAAGDGKITDHCSRISHLESMHHSYK